MGAFLLALVTTTTNAAEIQVSTRGFVSACGYYSNTQVDWALKYVDTQIPWGSKLYLVSGLGGQVSTGTSPELQSVRWDQKRDEEMIATAPYTWELQSRRVIHQRGNLYDYDSISFVVRVELPRGAVRYDNGSMGPMSYYVVKVSRSDFRCVTESGQGKPEFLPTEFLVRNP